MLNFYSSDVYVHVLFCFLFGNSNGSSRSNNPSQLQNIKTPIKLYYGPLYILSLMALFLTRMCHYALKISCKLSLTGTSLQICGGFRSLSYLFLLGFTSDSSKFCTWWRGLKVQTYLSYQTCLCLVVFSQVPSYSL